MKSYPGNVLILVVAIVLMAGCGLSNDPQSMIAKAQGYRTKNDYKAAMIELKNLLQKNPDHAEARYLLGVIYYDNHDYRLAEQELRRALQLSYERSKVMPVLGKAMLMTGDLQKVLDQIPLEAHASNAVQADILTLRARALIGLGRGDSAREVLETALTKQPEFPDALLELARLAVGDQKRDEASRLIERAIAGAPKFVDAWLMKADLARLNADPAGAMAANQKVIEIAPSNVTARLNIATLHIANDKLDEARKLIAEAKRLAPENVVTTHMQALVDFRARDYKAANDAIQQVLKVAPDYMPSVLLAGAILFELGSYEQAQVHLGRVLGRVPGNLYAQKLLALTLARSGQMQRALDTLQTGLKQAPEDVGLTTVAGELYMQNGEFAKAAKFFEGAAKRDPKSAIARANLGVSRMASGDTDRAFADLESAVELDSTQYQADMLLIASHLERGNYDQALKATETLEKKQPNNPSSFYIKATVYLKKKDVPSARKYFERALELQPTFWQAATSLVELDLQEKNPKGARHRLESILGQDKSNMPALLALAELGPALGATQKERIDWLERASKANPSFVEPRLMLARLYAQTGDIKKALEVALQAQSSSPGNVFALELVGQLQQSTGQLNQAIVTFGDLAKVQPKSPVALYQLAGAQAKNADETAAAATLRQALSLKPDFIEAQEAMVGLDLRAGRYSEALNTARRVQKEHAKSPIGFALEGDVLMVEKKFPLAIKAYEITYSMAKNAALLIKLHMAYEFAGKVGEGDARVAQWLKAAPDDAVVRLFAAEGALRRGVYKDAITHFEWLRQTQPDNVRVLNNLAWSYYQVKDTRALETAERAYKVAPDNAVVADTLGWLLVEQGNTGRGIGLLEKAAKVAPKNPEIGYHLAQGWIKAGDKSKARVELERVIATNVKFSQQTEALNLLKQLGK